MEECVGVERLETVNFEPLPLIRREKERFENFGGIELVKIEAPTMIEAHRKLGEEVSGVVGRTLRKRLNRLGREGFIEQIRLTRGCQAKMEEKLGDPMVPEEIRNALGEYFACLEAWTDGANLKRFDHPYLQGLEIDGKPIFPKDLALLLQNDNLNCQTGMLREKDGSVIIWHTEEEEDSKRFDRARVVTFKINGEEASAFIIPDLLPGPAFGWQRGFFQSVDFLHLKPPREPGTLANIATWLTWRLGNKVSPKMVIRALSPYVDGYALIVVSIGDGEVEGQKIEFAHNKMLTSPLPEEEGEYLFQVGIFSDQEGDLARESQKVSRVKKKRLEERIERTEKALRLIKAITGDVSLEAIWRMLAFRLGRYYAYASRRVRCHLVGRVSKEKGVELRLSHGPGVKGEVFVEISAKMDF